MYPKIILDFLRELAPFAWPIVVLILAWRIVPHLPGIASAGAIKLKVGDKEISLEKYALQLGQKITQVEREVSQIPLSPEPQGHTNKSGEAKRITTFDAKSSGVKFQRTEAPKRDAKLILWVDDHPENNFHIVQDLMGLGVLIDQVNSTNEALNKIHGAEYDVIISDMGRKEFGQEKPNAGIELVKKIRSLGRQMPIFIFCSSAAKKAYGQQAIDVGATNVTISPVNLFRMLSEAGVITQQ